MLQRLQPRTGAALTEGSMGRALHEENVRYSSSMVTEWRRVGGQRRRRGQSGEAKTGLARASRLCGDQAALAQIFEVGERRKAGGAGQGRIEPGIDFCDQIGNGVRALI